MAAGGGGGAFFCMSEIASLRVKRAGHMDLPAGLVGTDAANGHRITPDVARRQPAEAVRARAECLLRVRANRILHFTAGKGLGIDY